MKNDRFHVTVEIKRSPYSIAMILNDIANYLEGNEPPPDHWIEPDRRDTYLIIKMNIEENTRRMISKLFKFLG